MATTKTVIELTKEELKVILCEHFNVQVPNSTLSISIMKGDRPYESDQTWIIFETKDNMIKRK